MKKQIRQNVFETNSSSTHSISISNVKSDDLMEIVTLDDENNIELSGGEFGWEIEKYNDFNTKANYLAILIIMSDSEFGKYKEMFEDVIKTQTGCENIIYSMSDDYNSPNSSYIDHGSEQGIIEEACENSETLRQFLFNSNSWLLTTNDNCETSWEISNDGIPKTYEDEY